MEGWLCPYVASFVGIDITPLSSMCLTLNSDHLSKIHLVHLETDSYCGDQWIEQISHHYLQPRLSVQSDQSWDHCVTNAIRWWWPLSVLVILVAYGFYDILLVCIKDEYLLYMQMSLHEGLNVTVTGFVDQQLATWCCVSYGQQISNICLQRMPVHWTCRHLLHTLALVLLYDSHLWHMCSFDHWTVLMTNYICLLPNAAI